MNKTLKDALEDRLSEWAEWFKGRNDSGVGFPKETMLHRLRRDGLLVRAKAGWRGRTLPTNDNAEEVEAWVTDLYRYDKDLALVIRKRYFSYRKVPLRSIARKNGMSLYSFENKLCRARSFLCLLMLSSRLAS